MPSADNQNRPPDIGAWSVVSALLLDTNSYRVLAILLGLTIVCQREWSTVLGWYLGVLFMADVLYYGFAIALFDPEAVISRGYNLGVIFNDTLHSQGLDYGFNFYDNNYKKDRRQAQVDKFEYAYRQLGLAPGMSVLDCGCGCGDWMEWLQNKKGIHVVGVNVALQQVEQARSRGLTVIHSNWKTLDLNKHDMVGKFDVVTLWDTIEHYINAKDRNNLEKQNEVYGKLFDLVHQVLKKKTKENNGRRVATTGGKVWISCLHMKGDLTQTPWWSPSKLAKLYYCYILDKFHSGSYPSADTDQLVTCAKKKSSSSGYTFRLSHRKDTTMDYYMTSVLEPTHFGRTIFVWTPLRVFVIVANLFLDPNAIQRMLWWVGSHWMFQFDSTDISKSDMVHWWMVLEEEEAEASVMENKDTKKAK